MKEVDEYIASFPANVRKLLKEMRSIIKEAAPGAIEMFSYKMPTYVLYKNLVHFAGYKNHIGLYPAPRAIEIFAKELSKYKSAKGSVQFPIDEPLPHKLIEGIVKFRVRENLENYAPAKPVHPGEKSKVFASLSAPARRALYEAGIKTAKQLSKHSEKEILKLHGMGKASLPTLNKILISEGLELLKK